MPTAGIGIIVAAVGAARRWDEYEPSEEQFYARIAGLSATKWYAIVAAVLVGLHWLSPGFLQSVVQTAGFDARVTFQNIHVFAVPAVGAIAFMWYLRNGGPLFESLGRLSGWGLIAVGAGLMSGMSWAVNVGSIGLGNVLQGLGIAGVLDSDTIGSSQVIVSLSPEVILVLGGVLAGAYLSVTYLLTS